MFAGVYSPAGTPVVRKSKSHWFEPVKIWPNATYPAAMFGGPGYIMGKSIVKHIVDWNIPKKYTLWNEGRAVGVWVNVLEQRGISVKWTRLPGTNGFSWDYPIKNGNHTLWGAYPYALHHHLSRACISCLVMIERANNPDAEIDPCFQLDPIPEKWSWGAW